MAENEIQGFAGFDVDKMKDAVGAVLDSKDEVGSAVNFVRDHGDELIDLVGKLPELLASTAKALTDAANDVGDAADFLTGGKKTDRGVNALAGVAAEALDACRDELGSAKGLLETVGKAFDSLPIPDGGIGDRIGQTATRFDAVGDRLADVAGQLRKVGTAVDSAGKGLSRTAAKLEAGGSALNKFSS